MQNIISFWKNTPPLKLAIYLVALVHILLCIHATIEFGIGFSNPIPIRTLVIILFSTLWILCLTDNRFFFYAYIFLTLLSMISTLFITSDVYVSLAKTLYPLHLFFSAILILDLQRVIKIAHTKKSK